MSRGVMITENELSCKHVVLFKASHQPSPGDVVWCEKCKLERVVLYPKRSKAIPKGQNTKVMVFCMQCPNNQPADSDVLFRYVTLARQTLQAHHNNTGHTHLWLGRPFNFEESNTPPF